MPKSVLLLIFCALFILSPAPAASAQEKIITALDLEKILNLARGYGSASLSTDSQGDPLIRGKINGVIYLVFFYGCADNKDCRSLQFNAAWAEKMKPEDANAWNTQKRYTKSSIDSDGDINLKMDVMLQFGMTERNLEEYFDIWDISLKDFTKEVLNQ